MKLSIEKILIGLFAGSLIFATPSCKKDDEDEDDTTNTTATTTTTNTGGGTAGGTTTGGANTAETVTTLLATVDGKAFEGFEISASKAFVTTIISGKDKNDTGVKKTEDIIYIDMIEKPAAGPHSLGDHSTDDYDYGIRYFEGDSYHTYQTKMGSGTLIIEKITMEDQFIHNCKGTFKGWVYNTSLLQDDSLYIENGKFTVK